MGKIIIEFSYFSNKEKNGSSTIWWTSNDTVWGPFHTNDRINISGNPVFQGKATSYLGIYQAWGSDPEFNGGYSQSSEELPIPTDGVEHGGDKAQENGLYFTGQDTVYLEFKNDSLTYKYGANKPDTTIYLPTSVPNGTIFANEATVRLKGTVDGRYTIGTSGKTVTSTSGRWRWSRRLRRWFWWITGTTTTTTQGGNVFLDDDIVYKDDPRDGPSDDLLGIVAQNYVEIADTPPNQSDINIQAAIYVQSKGLTAENAKTKPDAGTINFYGSLIEGRRMEVGRFDPTTGQLWGYGRKYDYDERLKTISPPSFPKLKGFNVLAWYEGDPPN